MIIKKIYLVSTSTKKVLSSMICYYLGQICAELFLNTKLINQEIFLKLPTFHVQVSQHDLLAWEVPITKFSVEKFHSLIFKLTPVPIELIVEQLSLSGFKESTIPSKIYFSIWPLTLTCVVNCQVIRFHSFAGKLQYHKIPSGVPPEVLVG